jgi:hypothetical protein
MDFIPLRLLAHLVAFLATTYVSASGLCLGSLGPTLNVERHPHHRKIHGLDTATESDLEYREAQPRISGKRGRQLQDVIGMGHDEAIAWWLTMKHEPTQEARIGHYENATHHPLPTEG